MTKRKAAVAVAKDKAKESSEQVTLSTGVRVRINPVTPTLIDEVQARIPDPAPPEVFIEEKGRSEANYSDPKYLRDMERATTDRVVAALDAIAMFGITLVDDEGNETGVPENDTWVKKLRLMDKLGRLDLSNLDLEDPIEAEFAYKRYIALTMQDIALVSARSGLTEGDVAAAERIFRDTEE